MLFKKTKRIWEVAAGSGASVQGCSASLAQRVCYGVMVIVAILASGVAKECMAGATPNSDLSGHLFAASVWAMCACAVILACPITEDTQGHVSS